MDNKTYTITLTDGTIIENLTLNGNNYISKEQLSEEMFDDNCRTIVISDGEKEEVHKNMELVQIVENNNEYWFVLREITEQELAQLQIQSSIEYLAMMTGVEL